MSAVVRQRDHRSSVLVAALSAAFGVVLIQVTGALNTMIVAGPMGDNGTVRIMLLIVAFIFITIAVYVGSVVTVNTFATIIAGRTRTIALLRLIGSSARAQRRAVAFEGLRVGIFGSLIGMGAGTAVSFAMLRFSVQANLIPDLDYSLIDPVVVAPVAIVALSTWLASWVGSRRVLNVSPMQAIGAAQELSPEESQGRRARKATAIALFTIGLFAILGGVAIGLFSPLGILVALVGGLLSFSGLILGAHLVMPPLLRFLGRFLGAGPAARLAAANSVRYPERSSRATIGLVIAVTLVTMFQVAGQSYQDMLARAQLARPEEYQGVDQVVAATMAVFTVLIGFSALIAAVGMINNLSLSVLQRTREIGLLRALGFTANQVRRMILVESTQMTIAAVGLGLLLGIFYGWAGAQSLLGSQEGVGLIAPSVPWPLVVATVTGAAVLTLVASVAPARRAMRVSPIVALAAD